MQRVHAPLPTCPAFEVALALVPNALEARVNLMSMKWRQRSKAHADFPGTSPLQEGPADGSAQSTGEDLRERLRERAKRRLLGAKSRRLFLQVGLPWGAALLVGLVSVLYADWSTDASNAFLRLIAGHVWLAFVI